MNYELLLQAAGAESSWSVERVEQALSGRELTEANGTRIWKLKAGEIGVRPLCEGSIPVGLELSIPLSERTDLIREAVLEGTLLAREIEGRLLDPQLGRPLASSDEAAVAEQFFRTAQYAGQYLGISGALGAGFAAPSEGLSASTKWGVGLIGALFLLYLLVDYLLAP